jgi:shikimate dehydrogenase
MIRGTTRLAAVFGWPIAHSRSPEMLNAAFATAGVDAVMVPIGVPPEGFATAIAGLRAARGLGASVTIPHKLAALELCDEVKPDARAIGAVNCLQIDGDRLVGHSTDADGFLDSLADAGFALDGTRTITVLGAGGSARAIAHALRAHRITIVSRSPIEWARALAWTPDELAVAFADADLVVDCTSIGLGTPDEATLVGALPLQALRAGAWVATLVYHRKTILLERAAALGHAVVDGRGMLVHQGARAFTIWTGIAAPLDAMRRALDDALAGT